MGAATSIRERFQARKWLLALAGLLTFGAGGPAQADCVLNGTLVICSGASPNGFTAGLGQNGLSVNVQSGATVGNGTTNNITLNDNNAVMNFGSITVGAAATGIAAANNNSISNLGAITAGDGGTAVSITGTGSIFNSGSVTVGTAGAIGLSAPSVTNTGTITTGDFGVGINGTADFGAIVNRGTIITGDDGAGISSTANSLTIINSGSITFGGCGTGISAFGTGNTIVNSGTLLHVGCSGGGIGIQTGDSSTVTNSGTIITGDLGGGIVGGNGMNVTNNGRIVAGIDGAGIFITGGRATNNGTIIVGPTIGIGAGMLGNGDNIALTNNGMIQAGIGAPGMVTTGDTGVLVNTGTISGADASFGLIAFGQNSTLANSGTIIVGANGIGMGSQGRNATVTNSGTIIVGPCGAGIDTSPTRNATIVNTGSILGSGCLATGVRMGLNDTLANSGLISAPFSITSASTATVTNSGTLDGAIALAGPNSSLTNAGLITVNLPFSPGGGVQHTIDGAFTQTSAGTLALRVAPGGGAGTFDSLAATGAASLNGTLRATVTPGLYGSTTTYQVVSAGSLAGAFASVQVSSPFFNSTMAYNATSANLVLTRIPFNQLSTGGSNGRAIGNVLEANYSTNLTGTLASFYGNLLASSAPNTLSQLTGEVATAPQTASFAVFSQFFGTIFGQTASSRALGGAAAGLGDSRQTALRTTTPGGGTRVSLDGNETCSSEVCDTRRAPHRYTAWAQGFGGAGSVDGSGSVGSSRLDMNSGGGATGIDVRLDPDTLVGFTLGTATAAYDLSDLMSYGNAQSVIFGLYGGHSRGPAYIDGALAYGYSAFTTNRFIGTGTLNEAANASFNGYQYGGRVEGGWRLGIDQNVMTPFAALTVQAFQQSGYTENSRNATTGAPGVLGVTVQGQTATSVRSTLGAQFETAITAADDSVFRPRVRVGWAHEYNVNRSATVSLSSLLPGAPFQVRGAQPAADALALSAGFDLDLGGMVRLYGQFDSDISSNARAFAGTGGVRLIW